MDYFDAIRAMALKSVVKEDGGYRLRSIFRWYSTTFHTPLHEVDLIPLEDVLTAYYETKFSEMENEELQKEIDSLLETEAEKAERLRQVDADEADAQQMLEMARIANEKKKENQQKTLLERGISKDVVAPNLIKELPPDIKFEFVDRNLLEKEIEGFGTMTQPD